MPDALSWKSTRIVATKDDDRDTSRPVTRLFTISFKLRSRARFGEGDGGIDEQAHALSRQQQKHDGGATWKSYSRINKAYPRKPFHVAVGAHLGKVTLVLQ